MLRYLILLIGVLILFSCKTKQEAIVFSQFYHHIAIFPLQDSDTLLVVNYQNRQPSLYSFHTIDSTENRILLKNRNQIVPSVEFISAQKDTILSIFLVDEQNKDVIYRINPFLHLNDSLKSWYSEHEINFNFLFKDKFDTIQSLRMEFSEGFDFEISNLPIGKLYFQIKNYKGETGSNYMHPYFKNYYLSSTSFNEGFLKFEEDYVTINNLNVDSTQFLFREKVEFSQKEIKELKKEIGKHNFPRPK